MALEPGHVLLVKAPGMLLELSGGQELLVGALLEVEHEEQRVHWQPLEQVRQLALRGELRRQGEGRVSVGVHVAWHVLQQTGLSVQLHRLRGKGHRLLQLAHDRLQAKAQTTRVDEKGKGESGIGIMYFVLSYRLESN